MIVSKNNDLLVTIPDSYECHKNFTPDGYDCRYIVSVVNGEVFGDVYSTAYRRLIYSLMLHS